MFFTHDFLVKKGGRFNVVWRVSNSSRVAADLKKKVLKVDIVAICKEFLRFVPNGSDSSKSQFALYLCAKLMYGITRVYGVQTESLYHDTTRLRSQFASCTKLNKPKKIAVDVSDSIDPQDLDLAPAKPGNLSQLTSILTPSSLENSVLTKGKYQANYADITMIDENIENVRHSDETQEMQDLNNFDALFDIAANGDVIMSAAEMKVAERLGFTQRITIAPLNESNVEEVSNLNVTCGILVKSPPVVETPINLNGAKKVSPPQIIKSKEVEVNDVTRNEEIDNDVIQQQPHIREVREKTPQINFDAFLMEEMDENVNLNKRKVKKKLRTGKLIFDEEIEIDEKEMRMSQETGDENEFPLQDHIITIGQFIEPFHNDVIKRMKMKHLGKVIEKGANGMPTGICPQKWTFVTSGKSLMERADDFWADEMHELMHEILPIDPVIRTKTQELSIVNASPNLSLDEEIQRLLMNNSQNLLLNDSMQQNAHQIIEQLPIVEEGEIGEFVRKRSRISTSESPRKLEEEEVETKRKKRSASQAPNENKNRRASSLLLPAQDEFSEIPVLQAVEEERETAEEILAVGENLRINESGRFAWKSSAHAQICNLNMESFMGAVKDCAKGEPVISFEDLCPIEENNRAQAAKKFMLLLALKKDRKLDLHQDEGFSPILIKLEIED